MAKPTPNIFELIIEHGKQEDINEARRHSTCPFCNTGYYLGEIRLQAHLCSYCGGNGDRAKQLDDAVMELFDKWKTDEDTERMRGLKGYLRGYFGFELGARLRRIDKEHVDVVPNAADLPKMTTLQYPT